jgi:LMBR1 domain-containing protein 1
MLVLAWLVLFIPFSVFYYEEDDGELLGKPKQSPVSVALCYQFMVIFIVGTIFTICYLFLSYAYIPVQEYSAPSITTINQVLTSNPTSNVFSVNQLQDMTQYDTDINASIIDEGMNTVKIRLSIPTFFIGLMTFIGWFFFALFGGVGLSSMPLDFILAFKNRPRFMDAGELAEAQQSIRERVNELVDIGELIKIERDERNSTSANNSGSGVGFWKKLGCGGGGGGGGGLTRRQRKEEAKTLAEFKKAVYLLEKDVEDLKTCSENYDSYNPFIPYMKLVLGIISALLTLLWILQICLYILPKYATIPFLNSYLDFWRKYFPLFGTLTIAAFSLYALFGAIKGCFKCGIRFMFIQLYPMEYNKTYMSSFLFNLGLILLCCAPVVQLSTEAFGEYAANTSAYQIFFNQIQYLTFFKYFFENDVFVYALLVMLLLTTIYLCFKPLDKDTMSALELRDRLKARRR